MKTIPEAYEKIEEKTLKDLRSDGTLLRHRKTGARVFLLENEDDNKVFFIGFRTPVDNSRGMPHIVEHSVLCGSDKYPIKDPFVELVKGSLNTFLNAMTYPDKTVYPVASTNEKDFENLMDVYLDAVFHPNIYRVPEIFKQEGWHYEMESAQGDLTLNGVVYNEMKGAFSSPDDMLSREILTSLFKDTTYFYESGGDPQVIPELSYEEFLDFHRRYYHPSNSYIYLYGDMDMAERLEYLDREYLGKYDRLEIDSVIHHQSPYEAPVEHVIEYPIPSEEGEEGRAYLSYNLVVGDILDPMLYQAFDILDYALLSAPGAPIKEALLTAGIGKDILGGYDSGTLQPVFSVIAKDAREAQKEEFLAIIKRVLKEQADGALDHTALMAAIRSNEFKLREADFGSYPKGLMYGLQSLDSWLYDENDPFLHLDALNLLDELKTKVDTGYFEELIKTWLLENTHASMVMVRPKRGLTQVREEALKKKLADYRATLSEEEREAIVQNTLRLKEYQGTPDSQEALETLPMLQRSDLSDRIRPIKNVEHEIQGVKVVHHDYDTNGIHYLKLLFDVADMAMENVPALSLFCRMLSYVDTEDYTYAQLANETNLHTGGIGISPRVYRKDDGSFRFMVELSARFLYEELDATVGLISQILGSSKFTDKKRLLELVRREFSSMQMLVMSAGHILSGDRTGSYFSGSLKLTDQLNGIGYYDFLRGFEADFESRVEEFRTLCESFLRGIFIKERMMVSSTGDETALKQVESSLNRVTESISDEKYSHNFENAGKFAKDYYRPAGRNEGLQTAAQVQYVCRAGSFEGAGYAFSGAFKVLKTILSYEYFWLNVRVKGGAYGAFASFTRSGEVTFVSYRDPNLTATRDIFAATDSFVEDFTVSDRDMTKYVIGTISSMETPLTAAQNGARSLTAYLTGVDEEKLAREKRQVLEADCEAIRALAPAIRAAMEAGYICVIGNEANIDAARDAFGEVRAL